MAQGEAIVAWRREGKPYGEMAVQLDGHRAIQQPASHGETDRAVWLMVAGVSVLIVLWTVAILGAGQLRFAIYAPKAQVGVEAASTLARLFGSLVLFLFPTDKGGQRLRWLAAGFAILGLGSLLFGYLPPIFELTLDPNTAMYASLVTRILSSVLFAVGLLPRAPPHFSGRWVFLITVLFAALSGIAVEARSLLPPLTHVGNLQQAAARSPGILPGMTAWHWMLSAVALALTLAATVGAARRFQDRTLGGWLFVAMVLLSGSQLHNMLWPLIYSPVLTTSDLLRFAFGVVVVIGGVWELRRIAAERAALLAIEQDHSRRMAELNILKASFTSMVAHELGSPLGAIGRWTDMLETGELTPAEQARALAAIRAETEALTTLVSDVRTSATAERDDFAVAPRPVPLRSIIADAAAFARALPGDHPLTTAVTAQGMVWADPERIGQVLRNLLGNAAAYTPEGMPIELHVIQRDGRVRIEVADQGPGIHPDDLDRIFDKFGRGRDQSGRRVPGVGLGLYLSRRIVQAHGSDLTMETEPGAGATFGFELEVVP